MTVRPLRADDRAAWDPLWQAYLDFYETTLADGVTDATFDRLAGERDELFGFVAEDDDGALIGFVHALTHPSTWTADRYVYLEDLFVTEAARGRGVARALIEAVYTRAGGRKVYWRTHESNAAGRALYDKVAAHEGFIVYERGGGAP